MHKTKLNINHVNQKKMKTAKKIAKNFLFYGFTFIGGIGFGVFALFGLVGLVSTQVPFFTKDLNHQEIITHIEAIDPYLGFQWPLITWPWVYVIISTIISTVAWIIYTRSYNRA